jgi:hypothetical protein
MENVSLLINSDDMRERPWYPRDLYQEGTVSCPISTTSPMRAQLTYSSGSSSRPETSVVEFGVPEDTNTRAKYPTYPGIFELKAIMPYVSALESAFLAPKRSC